MAASGFAMECFGCHCVGLSLHQLKNTFSPCRDLICITEGSLGVLESQNPKCCNIVNECSYRIMRVFRMAASTLELTPSVPDFVSQFWRKIGEKAWKVTRVREQGNTQIYCATDHIVNTHQPL